MGFVGYKYSGRDVKKWAHRYLKKNTKLMTLEDEFSVSHSTIWWNFQHRLPELDVALYDSVLEKLDFNTRHKMRRK